MDYNKMDIDSIDNHIINDINIKAIYFLYIEDELVYIGKSINLQERIKLHTEYFETFKYIELPLSKLDDCEAFFIKKYKPIYNLRIPTRTYIYKNKEVKHYNFLVKKSNKIIKKNNIQISEKRETILIINSSIKKIESNINSCITKHPFDELYYSDNANTLIRLNESKKQNKNSIEYLLNENKKYTNLNKKYRKNIFVV